MQIYNYDQWLDLKFKSLEPDDLLDCLECDGEGEITETCHCCDNETEKTCAECGGLRYKRFEEIGSIGELRSYLTKIYYVRAVLKDLTDLASYSGHEPMNVIGPFLLERGNTNNRCIFDPLALLADAVKGRTFQIARKVF